MCRDLPTVPRMDERAARTGQLFLMYVGAFTVGYILALVVMELLTPKPPRIVYAAPLDETLRVMRDAEREARREPTPEKSDDGKSRIASE